MGVKGLKTFVERNDGLLIKDYHLHDTCIVIDACNLISVLARESQKHERRDLFGGDMVQFGQYVAKFFDNLTKCNIKPILVFDGAQTYDSKKSKTREKLRRAIEKFITVQQINKTGYGDFMLPIIATNVFRSIALDKGIRIVQCMFEADTEVARLGNSYKCPVISNDSDFYLMDLPHGLIPIDLMQHETVLKKVEADYDSFIVHYINCSLFKQDNFTSYFADLDKKTLPLLGILAGNDFVDIKVFTDICKTLPLRTVCSTRGVTVKQFRRMTNKQHEKIMKILYYLCGKTTNEIINQICQRVAKEKRTDLKKLMKANLSVYDIPTEDDFVPEIAKIYWQGFYVTFRASIGDDEKLKEKFEATMKQIISWLKDAMENSVLSYRCLEIANKNIIFIRPHMDDNSLVSAQTIQHRGMEVLLSLTRSSLSDNRKCIVYDRVGTQYKRVCIKPAKKLEHFGKLSYTMYDIPTLSKPEKLAIILATFHCDIETYNQTILPYYYYLFDPPRAEEYSTVCLLLDSLDFDGPRLWNTFRQAVWLCVIYYAYKNKTDKTIFAKWIENSDDQENVLEFMEKFSIIIKQRQYDKQPKVTRQQGYNCRLMHQITQFQASILTFNLLNSFLGELMGRVKSEYWLNSCLVYNLAENLRNKKLQLPNFSKLLNSFLCYHNSN